MLNEALMRSLLAGWGLSGFATIVEDEIRFWNGSKLYLCHCKDEKDRFKYQGSEIHLLLVDLTLPAGNGVEFAKKIVSSRPQAKIVLMSGFSDQAVHGHDFLAKPFSLHELIGKVKFHLLD